MVVLGACGGGGAVPGSGRAALIYCEEFYKALLASNATIERAVAGGIRNP